MFTCREVESSTAQQSLFENQNLESGLTGLLYLSVVYLTQEESLQVTTIYLGYSLPVIILVFGNNAYD